MIGKTSGWFNSVAGMVKTYIRSRFNSDMQNNQDSEKIKSLATVSPMIAMTTNFFAQSPSHITIKSSSNAVVQNMYDSRHRSPDPPPRNTRGNQSPLILRRKLELASASPLLQKR